MICVIGNATLATDGSATIIDFLFSSPPPSHPVLARAADVSL